MKKLTYEGYLESASETAIYRQHIAEMVSKIASPDADPEDVDNVIDLLCASYVVLGLCGEAGEIANKFKKVLRQGKTLDGENCIEIAKEYGDVGWYHAMGINEFRHPINKVMWSNIHKLSQRAANNTLEGEGDDR